MSPLSAAWSAPWSSPATSPWKKKGRCDRVRQSLGSMHYELRGATGVATLAAMPAVARLRAKHTLLSKRICTTWLSRLLARACARAPTACGVHCMPAMAECKPVMSVERVNAPAVTRYSQLKKYTWSQQDFAWYSQQGSPRPASVPVAPTHSCGDQDAVLQADHCVLPNKVLCQ